MRTLSAYDIVRICEWGRDKHALDRALVLLRAARPGVDPEALTRLSIGRRDALLLALRTRTFGPKLELHARCPACTEAHEFTMTANDLMLSPPNEAASGVLVHEGIELRYRLPDSHDLAAVARIPDPIQARDQLLLRCVKATASGVEVPLASMTPATMAALTTRLAEEDPQADIRFRLACVSCAHAWSSAFDVLTFFWAELEAEALQLQREVHALAKLYGWTEPYILAMGAHRRGQYLRLARADGE